MFSQVAVDHFVKADLSCKSCGNIVGIEKKMSSQRCCLNNANLYWKFILHLLPADTDQAFKISMLKLQQSRKNN